jgi:glutamate/tyrosine decarboxylase-like PLP-dependent enzyme
VVSAALGIFVISQVGYDGLFKARSEPVDSVPLAAWMGVAALGLGLVLLRAPEKPVVARDTVAGNSDNGAG